MEYITVPGENRGNVVLYALSTCLWCDKTKRLLNDMGVAYQYLDVDRLSPERKEEAKREVIRWRKRAIYPVLVINDTCIPMYNEGQIRKALA